MAEVEEEELLLLDDEDDVEDEELLEEEEDSKTDKKSSKTLIVLLISTILLLLIGAGGYFALKDDEFIEPPKEDTNASTIIKNIKKAEKKPLNKSKLTQLTEKANKLYESGKRDEALKIFKKISYFHKSLATFNLGVADMKQKKYHDAIKKFEKSFKLDELKFESSLNKAICYKALEDEENFQKELKNADSYIISKYNSPLFDYYYGLLEYYKNNPIESLSILKKYNTSFFDKKKNTILAKEYIYVKNYDYASETLAKTSNSKYYFTMGQLYAKNAHYQLALKSFQNSINSNQKPMLSRMGLALVQNKLGLFEDCSSSLKTLYKRYPDKSSSIFPIQIKIKNSLFDPIKAQKEFKKSIFDEYTERLKLVFYFAPYKLYNPQQSNTIIQKGAKEIYIDDIPSATSYLKQANSISQINLELINGLKLLQEHKVYEANALFKTLISKYPNHSVLHYNLALTYANIGDFKSAYKHFQKSYILDKNNYLALFFSASSSAIQGKDIDAKSLEDVMRYSDKKTQKRLNLLYKIIKNDNAINIDVARNNPFELMLAITASYMSSNYKAYKENTKKLKDTLPKDIVANIIYTDQISSDKDIKEYAQAIQENLTGTNLDLSPLIYGETSARELYIRILSIAGVVRVIKNKLENELQTNPNQIALLQSLAYSYLYQNSYEKAYKLYNTIIEEYNIKEPHTLFLASVASIGANHHANAIALLELANLDDKNFNESRYALGILYQEAKNLEGASIQFAKIGNSGFRSKYFDFDLKR